MLKGRKWSNTYLATIARHHWSVQMMMMMMKKDNKLELSDSTVAFISCRSVLAASANTLVSLLLQLMKTTVLAESSSFINLHHDLSAPAMSTDISQVGVALFPSF